MGKEYRTEHSDPDERNLDSGRMESEWGTGREKESAAQGLAPLTQMHGLTVNNTVPECLLIYWHCHSPFP